MKALIKKQLFDGKFDIQGEIARGQTGTILYGYDIGLRQEVAIKIYHSQINGRSIRGKTFVEKSKPLLRLEHPNLIKIFKVEEESDTAVVFMEFFDAPSLQQLIHDKGRLSVQDMLILAREIAEVLVHTHFQGIIHGTLHPGHVLVGPQGQIKVMDLGLSWLIMDILAEGDEEILRPLPYFPPELAKEELLNVSSDLYALGFMMYEMVTGTVPYAGLPKTSIMGKLAFDQADPTFDFPTSIPTAICDLIREMTRNRTQHRLQDATYVLTVISQQLSKLPLSKASKFLPSEPPQPQTHTPDEHIEPTKTVRTQPLPSAIPEPSLTRAPQVQRPTSAVDYGENNSTAKIGTIIALIVVIGIAGGLGYWYRDTIEPYISGGLTQAEHSSGKITREQPLPEKQNSSTTPSQDILGNPKASEPNIQQPTRTREAQPNKAATKAKKQPIAPTSSTPAQQQGAKTDPVIPKVQPRSNTQSTKIAPVQKSPAKPPSASTIQGQPVIPAKKQTKPNVSSVPVQQQPAKTTPAVPKIAPPSKTQARKSAPIQQSPTKSSSANNTSQGKPVIPVKKQTKPTLSSAPIQQQPTKAPPTVLENAPLLSPNSTESGNLQKSPAQPKAQNATQAPTVIPTEKPALSSPSPTPVQQQPIKTTPVVPEGPLATTSTPRSKPTKNAVPALPANETLDQIKKTAASAPASSDSPVEATDAEIEEILQSLDAAKKDLSSIAAP